MRNIQQTNTSSANNVQNNRNGFGLRHCPAPSGVLPPDIAMVDAMEELADVIPPHPDPHFGFHDI